MSAIKIRGYVLFIAGVLYTSVTNKSLFTKFIVI